MSDLKDIVLDIIREHESMLYGLADLTESKDRLLSNIMVDAEMPNISDTFHRHIYQNNTVQDLLVIYKMVEDTYSKLIRSDLDISSHGAYVQSVMDKLGNKVEIQTD